MLKTCRNLNYSYFLVVVTRDGFNPCASRITLYALRGHYLWIVMKLYYLALDIVVCLPGVPEKKYHGSTGIFY